MRMLGAALLVLCLLPAAATTRIGGVSALADMPQPRAAHSATRLADGRVLLAGGCHSDGCEEGISGDALLFDPTTARFVAAGRLVERRVGHRAVALKDGSVLLIGGWTGAGATASIERFDPKTATFAPHGRLLTARDGFSATPLRDGNLLIVGGYAGDMRHLAAAELYDPRTRTSKAVGSLATARKSHTATLLPDDRVLIAGGSVSRTDVTDRLEIFDPASTRFAAAGTLAKARQKHAAVLLGDRVLILGGAGIPESAAHFADSEVWGVRDGHIGAGPRMADGRYKFLDSVVVLGNGDVLVAGSGGHAEVLDRSRNAFKPVGDAPPGGLAFATATMLGDGRVLVAGGYDRRIRVSPAAWLYRASPRASR